MEIAEMLDRIRLLAKEYPGLDRRGVVKICLMDVGIRSSLDGYWYLFYVLGNWECTSRGVVCKELYPMIASHFGVDCEQASVGIRRAIQSAWKEQSAPSWKIYFPERRKPNNAEFILRMLQVLEFWDAFR